MNHLRVNRNRTIAIPIVQECEEIDKTLHERVEPGRQRLTVILPQPGTLGRESNTCVAALSGLVVETR
jgi:hypothetical protein